jgi:hypothetical protein
MAVVQSQHRYSSRERALVIPSVVLAALDQFAADEQAAVRLALDELRHLPTDEPRDSRLRRIASDEPIYALRAAPQVLLLVRLDLDGPVEVVEIVRPETLRRMFPADDAARPQP